MGGFSVIFHAQYLLIFEDRAFANISLSKKTFSLQPLLFVTAVAVSKDSVQYCSSLSACNWVKMGAGYWGQRQWVREKGVEKFSVVRVEMARNTCILHFFLLQTVNG